MYWVPTYNMIQIYKGDFGGSIYFSAFDFKIGDKIIFVFEDNIIEDKEFIIDKEDYTFELTFNEEEVQNLEAKDYKMAIKQYRNDVLLQTLSNGILRVEETEKWQK